MSDIHEQWASLDIPKGDVLIVAGDVCERSDGSFAAADHWFASISSRFRRAIYVPGNHDAGILLQPRKYKAIAPNLLAAMLIDETIKVEGIRLHGMPWESPGRRGSEALIPNALDVLVTHEPPYGILDWSPKSKDVRLGNTALRKHVKAVKPRVHIFGHCHMAHGHEQAGATTFFNVAICGAPHQYYRAYHPVTVIDIEAQGPTYAG